MRSGGADRHVVVGGDAEPEPVAVLVEVARVVERDRLEEDAHRAVDLRRRDARPQHRGGIVGPRGRRDHETGDVAEHPEPVVVVEVPAEAALVAEPLDADDHPVAVRALGEELERRRLAAQLILGVVEVREVLDLGDRHEARHRRSEREPEDRRLVEQRVEHPLLAESRLQTARDPVDAALRGDVLAEDERLGMRARATSASAALIDWASVSGSVTRSPVVRASTATSSGERGASGRMTSSAVVELWVARGLERALADRGAGLEVLVRELVAARSPPSTSQRAVARSGSGS